VNSLFNSVRACVGTVLTARLSQVTFRSGSSNTSNIGYFNPRLTYAYTLRLHVRVLPWSPRCREAGQLSVKGGWLGKRLATSLQVELAARRKRKARIISASRRWAGNLQRSHIRGSVFRFRLARKGGLHLLRFRCHDQALHLLDAPALPQKLGGQPIQQLRFEGSTPIFPKLPGVATIRSRNAIPRSGSP